MIRRYQVGFTFAGTPGATVTQKMEMSEVGLQPELIIAMAGTPDSAEDAMKCIREIRFIKVDGSMALRVGDGISIANAEVLRHQGQHEGQAQITVHVCADKGEFIEIDALIPPSGKLRFLLIGNARK